MDTDDKTAVLVTGLSGMVGTRLQALYGSTYRFIGLDLQTGVDITQAEQLTPIFASTEAKTVIHLAAFTDVSAAHDQNGDVSGACYRVNVTGTENIAAKCREYDKYLIHVSTDFVFDGSQETAYAETDIPHPIEWYGMTKLLAEQRVTEMLTKKIILRLAYPYQRKPIRPDFLLKITDKLRTGTLPPQFCDHFITPTWVDDFARVLHYCCVNQPQGLYHACGSSAHSDFEIASLVKETFTLPGEVMPGTLDDYLKTIRRPYQKYMRLSNRKLVGDFGLHMASFPEGLQQIRREQSVV